MRLWWRVYFIRSGSAEDITVQRPAVLIHGRLAPLPGPEAVPRSGRDRVVHAAHLEIGVRGRRAEPARRQRASVESGHDEHVPKRAGRKCRRTAVGGCDGVHMFWGEELHRCMLKSHGGGDVLSVIPRARLSSSEGSPGRFALSFASSSRPS